MKRIALLLTAILMFFTLTACSSQSTTPSVTKPGTNSSTTSQGELELVNQDGVKIILVGKLDLTGNLFGPQLHLRIENNSGHDLTVQSRKTSVNGYTLGDFGASMSIDVVNGEKAYGTFTLINSDLQEAGITTIESIRTTFHVFDSDTWDTYFDSDPVTITF